MSYSFISSKSEKITIEKLSYAYCEKHFKEILQVINIIPYIHWEKEELLSQEEDMYKNKWNYSYILKHNNVIIGVLIAYFRKSDDKHIFDSLYIHRFAIEKRYQNHGIGTEMLKYFIFKSYSEIPWLLNISVQTNKNSENSHVIQFYKKNGFNEMYDVLYPNKTDILFLLERDKWKKSFQKEIQIEKIELKHPRVNNWGDKYSKQIVTFASTNDKKKKMIIFIFNNYNIEVEFANPPIDLTEPQVENNELEEERKLVSIPLKTVSRFINSVPYIIEDTMLFVEFFNRYDSKWELPGFDTKRWLRQLKLDGMLDVLGSSQKRKAKFVSQTGAYMKANSYYFGRGEMLGSISYKISQVDIPKYGTYPYFFHLIFIPDGADKTLAEMDMYEYSKYDYMRKSIVQLLEELSKGEEIPGQYELFDYL